MNKEELERIYIRSLDQTLSSSEQHALVEGLKDHPAWAKSFYHHRMIREALQSPSASFGHFFAAKVMYKIENNGVIVDRQIFGVFKRFQLAALGVVVALLIMNVVLADQGDWKSVLGFNEDTTAVEQEVPFNFAETLNNL